MSYSSATSRSKRGGASGNGRPGLHARQHSANTAGDVFAMFGSGSAGSPAPGAAAAAGSSGGVASSKLAKSGQRNDSDSVANGIVTRGLNGACSPSSSGPSTPTSGSEKSRRFSSLYSPPVLLKLWSSELTAKIGLEDLYSSFEPPEMQQQYINQQSQGYHEGASGGGGKYTVSALHSKRGDHNALGRLPHGASATQPGIRRTASGEYQRDRQQHHGIQGGVLSGVNAASQASDGGTVSRSGAAGDATLRGNVRGSRYGQRGAEAGDQPPPLSSKAGGGPAWTSNRWRHLQPEDDSSGNSSPNEDGAEPWSTGPASAEWKPMSGSDLIQQERERLRSVEAETSLQDWDADDKQDATPVPTARTVDSPAPLDLPSARPSMPTSSSNRSLLMDDLLAPTRASPAPSSAPCHPTTSLSNGGLSNPSSRSNSIITPLSMLNIGGHDPVLSASVRGIRQNGGNITPSRAAAAEGLELLARRSPVQEVSMAALQQQYMPSSQPIIQPIRHLPADQIFWQYRDPSGQVQGPFSAIQMQDWFRQGFFNDTLLVKRVESADFETLGALVIRVGDVSQPFLSPLAPRVYAPPGMPGFGQSPVTQRAASPALWRSHAHGSQTSSREGSYSSPIPPTFSQDPFAQHQAHAQPSYSNLSPDIPTAGASSVPLDPWADMAPVPQLAPRGSSALGDSEVPSIEIPQRRTIAAPKSAIGPISPIVSNPIRQPESVPSPIGRAAVSASPAPREAASPVQAPVIVAPPVKEEVKEVPSVPAPVSKPTPIAPTPTSTISEEAAKPAKATEKPKATVPLEVPSAPSSGKVKTLSREAFDKQKAAEFPSAEKTEIPLSALVGGVSPAPIVAPKAAPWAKTNDDEGKVATPTTLTPSSSMSLREIQAKEQKEAEARKAAEKRALAARLAVEEAANAERLAKEAAEALPASSKWGEMTSPPTSAPASSPWAKPAAPTAATTRSGTVKKTLKEIQEEEARQKKEAAVQAQARAKAYAASVSSANASSPSAASNAGGAWTTVGSGSKPVAPAASSAAKPAISAPALVRAPSATNAVPSMASRLAGNTAPVKAASPAPAATSIKVVPAANGRSATPVSAGKPDDSIAPASSDLIKWCREALKGLQIPVDDFISMLLSFPVPLDKSVRELVSDSVYSASRTLDGRHFADAFADKRLADTKAIKAGKSQPAASGLGSIAAAAPKQPSAADVLKFVPAPKGPEQNFKVVTKSKGKKK